MKQKITTFLTFNNQAEEAMNFYTAVFKNSKIVNVHRMPANGPMPAGTVLGGNFILDGQEFHALNGGPSFSFSQGISLFVNCDTQEEIDEIWGRMLEGGQAIACGWIKDKFGISWQIIPGILGELLQDQDAAKAGRVMQAMMQMVKIDIRKLKEAYGQ